MNEMRWSDAASEQNRTLGYSLLLMSRISLHEEERISEPTVRKSLQSHTTVTQMNVPYFSFKSKSSATTGVIASFVAFAAFKTRISSAFAVISKVNSSTLDIAKINFLSFE